mmetsp:Transcript_49609/g.153151  ORF Transcript_49609/g.153151 Transcript_49609/m.153151 type:complete len:373 (+) Transcript_49609:286-1404(+)
MQHADLLLVSYCQRVRVHDLVALTVYLEIGDQPLRGSEDDVHGRALENSPPSKDAVRRHHESQQPAHGEDLQLPIPRILVAVQDALVKGFWNSSAEGGVPQPLRGASGNGVDVQNQQHLRVGLQPLTVGVSKLEHRRGVGGESGIHALDHASDALPAAAADVQHRPQPHDRVDHLVAPLALRPVELNLVGDLRILRDAAIQQHGRLDDTLTQGLTLLIDAASVVVHAEGEPPDVVHRRPCFAPAPHHPLQLLAIVCQQLGLVRVCAAPAEVLRKVVAGAEGHDADAHLLLRVDAVPLGLPDYPHHGPVAAADDAPDDAAGIDLLPQRVEAELIARPPIQQAENMKRDLPVLIIDVNDEGLRCLQEDLPHTAP